MNLTEMSVREIVSRYEGWHKTDEYERLVAELGRRLSAPAEDCNVGGLDTQPVKPGEPAPATVTKEGVDEETLKDVRDLMERALRGERFAYQPEWLFDTAKRMLEELDRLRGVEADRNHLHRRLGEANEAYGVLFKAVREHHRQKADDRCIEDDDRLYAAAGLPPCDRRVGSKSEMLANCARFIERRCQDGGPWKTYAELEKENAELRSQLAARKPGVGIDVKVVEDFCNRYAEVWINGPGHNAADWVRKEYQDKLDGIVAELSRILSAAAGGDAVPEEVQEAADYFKTNGWTDPVGDDEDDDEFDRAVATITRFVLSLAARGEAERP